MYIIPGIPRTNGKLLCLCVLPDGRAGHGVGSGSIPFVERDTRVPGGVDTRNLEERSRAACTGALDLELVALNVKLGLAHVSLVKTNVLNADEVLAGGDVGRDGVLEAVLLPAAPSRVGTRVVTAQTRGHDREPIAGTVVVLDGCTLRWSGHHDKSWTGVLDELVVEEFESELVAGLDGVCASVAGLGANIASEIGAAHDVVGECRVVRVGIPADIGILSANGLTVNNEAIEDVMGLSERCHEHSDESECLEQHGDGSGQGSARRKSVDAVSFWY
jgi:hypothetical protein